ncbi:MAG: type II secretion system protein M [Gammaproteobacteria bacterium]
MKTWFLGLAPRERLLIGGAAGAVVLLLAYLLVVEPLQQRRAVLERGVVAQRELLAWMRDAVVPLRGNTSAPADSRGQSLFAVVDRSARATVLAGALQRVQPEGQGNVRVWFNDAPFDDLVRWIATLQREHGITVNTLSVERVDTAGLVNARVTLERTP